MNAILNVKRFLLPLLAVALFGPVAGTNGQSIRQSVFAKANFNAGPGVHADLEFISRDGTPLKLDLVLPNQGQGPFPVVLILHGTGFSKGRMGVRKHAEELAASGYAAIAVGFRHESKDAYPAALQDVEASVDWVFANAEKHNLDKDRIGMLGFSGGGSLATLVSTQKPLRIRAVASYFAPSDLTVLHKNATGAAWFFVPGSLQQWLGGTPLQVPQQYKLASPITHVHEAMAPHLLLHGAGDSIVPVEQSLLLHKKMKQERAKVKLITFADAGHNFDEGTDHDAKAAFGAVQLFFAEHLTTQQFAAARR